MRLFLGWRDFKTFVSSMDRNGELQRRPDAEVITTASMCQVLTRTKVLLIWIHVRRVEI